MFFLIFNFPISPKLKLLCRLPLPLSLSASLLSSFLPLPFLSSAFFIIFALKPSSRAEQSRAERSRAAFAFLGFLIRKKQSQKAQKAGANARKMGLVSLFRSNPHSSPPFFLCFFKKKDPHASSAALHFPLVSSPFRTAILNHRFPLPSDSARAL